MFKKFLSLLLCLIMMLSLVACSNSSNDEDTEELPTTENTVTEDITHEDLSNPDAPEYRDDTIADDMGGITTCMVGETVELDDCNITLVGYDFSNGNEWEIPEEGCRFIGVNFIIENTTDEMLNISSLMDFTAYIDDFQVEDAWADHLFGNSIDAELAPNKKVSGWITYNVPENWGKLEIDYNYINWESMEGWVEARFLIENEG